MLVGTFRELGLLAFVEIDDEKRIAPGLNAAQCFEVNLGTGTGYSVLDVVKAFEKASGRPVAYELAPRRASPMWWR